MRRPCERVCDAEQYELKSPALSSGQLLPRPPALLTTLPALMMGNGRDHVHPLGGAEGVAAYHASELGAGPTALSSGAWGVGNVKLKVEPCPGTLVTVIAPPCSSTSARVMARPNPVPPAR